MIKKIHRISTALLFGLGVISVQAVADVAQDVVPQQCQQLFKATDQLVSDAEKQPGTHTQVSKIKNKLNQSKKQILEMELATQVKSCEQGLAKLNRLTQQENEGLN